RHLLTQLHRTSGALRPTDRVLCAAGPECNYLGVVMGQGRRHFTDEFKQEAIALLVSSGRPLSQIANELGISPSMLRNWRNGSGGRDAGSALRPIPASALHSVPDPAAEISRLRRENDRLRMERDILKKTVAIFSEPPR